MTVKYESSRGGFTSISHNIFKDRTDKSMQEFISILGIWKNIYLKFQTALRIHNKTTFTLSINTLGIIKVPMFYKFTMIESHKSVRAANLKLVNLICMYF